MGFWQQKYQYGKYVQVSRHISFHSSIFHAFTRGHGRPCQKKKGVIGILKLLWTLGERSLSVFFKIFDCQILPMLTYGAEIWGLDADLMIIERIHLFALKRFLNTRLRTPNVLVYGETGRYPLSVFIYTQCISYWLKLLRMPDHRLPVKSYKMSLNLHNLNKKTWASSVCYLLYSFGYGFVWENQGVGRPALFLRQFKLRLKDCWNQDWHSKLSARDNLSLSEDRYSFYRSFKSSLVLSSYQTSPT